MTTLAETISKGSAGFQRLNAHLLGPVSEPSTANRLPQHAGTPARNRIRQNSAGLNKTEQRFKEWVEANFPDRLLFTQAVTLRIANGCRYTPDFVSFHDNCLAAYEIKGPHAWDDAIVKLKVAAAQFTFIHFTLVSWSRADGVWRMEGVKP